MSNGRTKMWGIEELPGWEVEQTPGAWCVWAPCCDNEECPTCGGENTKIVASCGIDQDGAPTDLNMVARATGLASFTPVRIQ